MLEREEEASSSGGNVDYTISEILPAVRRACLSLAGVPVLCGASLKGIGAEPLLDSVTSFLPSPLDRPPATGVLRPSVVSAGRGKAAKRKAKRAGRSNDDVTGRLVAAADARGGGEGECGIDVVVDPLQDELVAFVFKVKFCWGKVKGSSRGWFGVFCTRRCPVCSFGHIACSVNCCG